MIGPRSYRELCGLAQFGTQVSPVLDILTIVSLSVWLRFAGIKEGELIRHDGRKSDGYLEHIFKHAAKELFDTEVKEITYKVLR